MTINHQKLLRGRYEAERFPKDFSSDRMVPDFAFNVLNALGLLYRPVLDEDYIINGGQKPIWPDEKSFAVCLTHDVDAVSLFSFQESLRRRERRLSQTHNTFLKIKGWIGFTIDYIKMFCSRSNKDSLHCYELWLQEEEKIGARSTFFFWPGLSNVNKHHHTDRTYELNDKLSFDRQQCTVAEMIREIDSRGWEVGLHPSWYSFNNVDELKRQKEALEEVLGHDIYSIRQHYLHFDIRITPRVHSEAGLKFDSTLGFNDNIGFRFGTCYPWKLYDLKNENELSIIEIPLIVQDGAMLNPYKGMRLDGDTAFEYIIQIVEEVERVGGVFTLLWHSNSIIRPEWWSLYLRTLKYLHQKNPWFTTIKEIGEWWKRYINIER